jgi:pyruvate,water dikinase
MNELVISIDTEKELGLSVVGGKGLNIIKLVKIGGIDVPKGFIISTLAFEEFLESNKIKIKKNVKENILKSEFSENLKKEILGIYNQIFKPEDALIVRSSSTLEDIKKTSFAGQFESYLNVREFNNLLHYVKKCWCSAFSERVSSYLKAMKVKKKISMAVIVQKLVNADSAGVMFTINPIPKDKNQILIESNFGLGPTVVSGLVTPDSFIVDKNSLIIVDKNLGSKKIMAITEERGIENIQVSEEKRKKYSLDDEQVIKLAELGKFIEKKLNYPQDVEWSIEKGKIFITQTRPVTV